MGDLVMVIEDEREIREGRAEGPEEEEAGDDPHVALAERGANRRHGLAEGLAVGARRDVVNEEEGHAERDQREEGGQRPVLILSHDVFNERSGTVIAVALTSQPQRAGFPLTLELTTPRLPKRSWVKISQIRTLATERIGNRLGRASPEELTQVLESLNEILGA